MTTNKRYGTNQNGIAGIWRKQKADGRTGNIHQLLVQDQYCANPSSKKKTVL